MKGAGGRAVVLAEGCLVGGGSKAEFPAAGEDRVHSMPNAGEMEVSGNNTHLCPENRGTTRAESCSYWGWSRLSAPRSRQRCSIILGGGRHGLSVSLSIFEANAAP